MRDESEKMLKQRIDVFFKTVELFCALKRKEQSNFKKPISLHLSNTQVFRFEFYSIFNKNWLLADSPFQFSHSSSNVKNAGIEPLTSCFYDIHATNILDYY